MLAFYGGGASSLGRNGPFPMTEPQTQQSFWTKLRSLVHSAPDHVEQLGSIHMHVTHLMIDDKSHRCIGLQASQWGRHRTSNGPVNTVGKKCYVDANAYK